MKINAKQAAAEQETWNAVASIQTDILCIPLTQEKLVAATPIRYYTTLKSNSVQHKTVQL